jgi:HEPN domain-containing protein
MKTAKNGGAKLHLMIEDLEIAGLRARFGPIGLHIYAANFLAAAKAFPPTPPPPFRPAAFFLPCRAAELALKAFLSLKGRPLLELAGGGPYGHVLAALVDEAIKQGVREVIELSDETVADVKQASRYYSEKVLEYPALLEAGTAYQHLPKVETMQSIMKLTGELLDAIRDDCTKA